MKKIVIALTLVCVFIACIAAFADYISPKARELIYDGTAQYLVEAGRTDQQDQHFYYRNPFTNEWGTDVPAGKFPGTYTVEWLLVNGDTIPDASFNATNRLSVVIKEFNPPQPAKNLVYKPGDRQYLVEPGTGVALNGDEYYYRNRYSASGEWTLSKPEAIEPGTYTIEYFLADPDGYTPVPSDKGTILTVVINKSSDAITPEVSPEPVDDSAPRAFPNLVANGTEQQLLIPGKDTGKTMWYRLVSFTNASFESKTIPSKTWSTEIPTGSEPGIYIVEYLASDTQPGENDSGKQIRIEILASNGSVSPNPRPSGNSGNHSSPFYYIGDGSEFFDGKYELPATGFPTHKSVPLALQPESLEYADLSMRIQIPSINVDVELTGVPETENTWAVEWLGNRAGLLSGSALPGDGFAMIAAHNHLNTEEIGPFALLFGLEENDRIFINTADGGLQIFSVYANELLEPEDLGKMASIAQSHEGSIILVTCENEMIEGGYQNRRVVFARPLF
ncbi:MAG: class F sortase [Anaerolineaceae bacterium]|nr:class F sortase [Anaerolineaceae bacterium]